MMLLGQPEYPFDDLLIKVNLHDNAVGTGKNLIALPIQNIHQRRHVRPLGNGRRHIPGIVEHRQPGAQPVGCLSDILRIHLMIAQLFQNILAVAAFVGQAQQGGPQLAVGNILRHIPAHTAVLPLHPPHIAPCGNKGRLRVALDIHKDHADH